MKMNSSLKKFNVIFVLAMVLALVLLQVPNAYSAEPTAALTFLTDVVRLDMKKYNAKLVTVPDFLVTDSPSLGPFDEEIVKYTLESKGSKLDVICKFRNNALVWCKLYPLEGSPLFAQPFTNVLDEAKGLLDRYQTYSGVSHVQPMRNMLDTVTELTPMTKAVGDVRLEITIDEDRKSIQWMNAVNGITNNHNVVILSFRNGAFESFWDSWNRYKIGNAEVNVDKEEVVRMAVELAQKHSWTAGNITVSNVTIVDKSIIAKLLMQPRDDNALYPEWDIRLGLDKVYPGGITEISVFIWADTGEVDGISLGGGYGAPPSEEPPTTPPTEPPTEPPPDNSTGKTSLDPTPILIAIPIALAIILGVVFYRKRKG